MSLRRGTSSYGATFAVEVCVVGIEHAKELGKTYCEVTLAGSASQPSRETRSAVIDTTSVDVFVPRKVVRVQVRDTIYDRLLVRAFR